MALAARILNIREGLKKGRYGSEASVSQGIVLPLLQALDWPIFDIGVVCPEYTLGPGRVDFALCHPSGRPVVVVEVKRTGETEGSDRQVFEYAFHAGVPMAILSDGQEWHFYLPGETGPYQERRVYMLDILERDLAEAESRLKRYLDYHAWCAGTAIEAAKQDYRDVAKRRQIEAFLPIAWKDLLKDQDEILLELIADKVESLCGYKPDVEIVSAFVADLTFTGPEQRQQASTPHASTSTKRPHSVSSTTRGALSYAVYGQHFAATSAKDVLIGALEALAAQDSTFLARFAARPQHARIRRYVAKDKSELYPGRPDLCEEYSHQLRSGWWIGTNYSRQGITKILGIACEVAGIALGKDLQIDLG